MSATGRSDVRRADDWYATPAWAVRAIWPKLAAFDTCLDPCAGQGAILTALQELASMPRYHGIELDEERATICAKQNGFGCIVHDALDLDWRRLGLPYELIITNPPYSLAQEFLEKALSSGASQVCFLMRLNYLGSMQRAAFWRKHPCDVWVLPKRPSFAVFLSCKTDLAKDDEKGCGWKASFPLGATLPKACPVCINPKLTKCSSDATEYAWFHFRPERLISEKCSPRCSRQLGHWGILDL
jgi:hypothetical protein